MSPSTPTFPSDAQSGAGSIPAVPRAEVDGSARTSAAPGVALVTGASAGIGAEYARQLAAAGYALVLVARDTARLDRLADALRSAHGVEVEVLTADLASDDGLDRVVARIGAEPAIDVLVNNAGFGSKGTFARADPAGQEAMVRVHVLAVNRLTHALLPRLVARRAGAIVTVSSVASYLTSPGNVNYCATKGYQRLFMEGLARELEGSGVYVQALCPGFTRTEFHERAALVMTGIPDALWLSATRVVAESLAAMRRRTPTTLVPSRRYRAIVAMLRLLPASLVGWASRRYRRDRQA